MKPSGRLSLSSEMLFEKSKWNRGISLILRHNNVGIEKLA